MNTKKLTVSQPGGSSFEKAVSHGVPHKGFEPWTAEEMIWPKEGPSRNIESLKQIAEKNEKGLMNLF